MDERIIPTIVLALNFLSMIGLLFFQFLVELSSLLMIASWLSVAIVAFWVYENDKRTEFLEEHVWKKIERPEQDLEYANRRIEETNAKLEKRNE